VPDAPPALIEPPELVDPPLLVDPPVATPPELVDPPVLVDPPTGIVAPLPPDDAPEVPEPPLPSPFDESESSELHPTEPASAIRMQSGATVRVNQRSALRESMKRAMCVHFR
jgi:hypothetical protein